MGKFTKKNLKIFKEMYESSISVENLEIWKAIEEDWFTRTKRTINSLKAFFSFFSYVPMGLGFACSILNLMEQLWTISNKPFCQGFRLFTKGPPFFHVKSNQPRVSPPRACVFLEAGK